ncbi:MAG: DUF3806 domain-containing protein [Pseudomonadota bacterium]
MLVSLSERGRRRLFAPPFFGAMVRAMVRAMVAAVYLAFSASVSGQTDNQILGEKIDRRITPLSTIDQRYMNEQRTRVNDLSLRYYGGRCCRRPAEVNYLQRLLDDRLVSQGQELELQAMGVVLGDLLAAELGMNWVVYEDAKGRSRALRLEETDAFLFPVTMISRRRMSGDQTPVIEIYREAVAAIESVREPLPFQ